MMAQLEVCVQIQALYLWLPGSFVWDASARLPFTRKSKHGIY
jgi:hypothetical protein